MDRQIKYVDGGICSAKGFKANGLHAGFRKNITKNDLALIVSDNVAHAAAIYTTNLVKGAPLVVTKENLEKCSDNIKAIICNSGNANTCNDDGVEVAKEICEIAANGLNVKPEQIIVASTGLIGLKLPIEPFVDNIDNLVNGLSYEDSLDAAGAITTTDRHIKEIAAEFYIGNRLCHLGGIAKGSGMIHPNMATMLVFLTTDVSISSSLLDKALKFDVQDTFNMISVDGDTSTNDMVTIMANGCACNDMISDENSKEYEVFLKALNAVTTKLCQMIAADGERCTKFLTCNVVGAKNKGQAKLVSRSVISSNLVKQAMFGCDANWGRVLCAIGYSKADIDPDKIDLSFTSKAGRVNVCKDGHGINFSEDEALAVLSEDRIEINVDLNDGPAQASAWGCDMKVDYKRT